MTRITNVQFEHYHPPNTIGVEETRPRISWQFEDYQRRFQQDAYEIELSEVDWNSQVTVLSSTKRSSPSSYLVPWPHSQPLSSRQKVSIRVRAWDLDGHGTEWSEPAYLEVGLLDRSDWKCLRIAAPWGPGTSEPDTEQLYRREFRPTDSIANARLYITAQGTYEVEINGRRVGDHFLAPGWTTYDGRLQYQTYDITEYLSPGDNCIGVRVAEGWFSGRIGFEGGHRNIWGSRTALLVQMEVTSKDGAVQTITSDGFWSVTRGPIRLAEIYDGEKYEATMEIPAWSSAGISEDAPGWSAVLVMPHLPDSVKLTAGFGEPVRRIEARKPVSKIVTSSGKVILDFGQNLVGYVKLSNIKGPRGHKVIISHAEVLEDGELCTRPLRICKAIDEYTLRGDCQGEEYAPRFTFHGFRYAQIDNWTGGELETSAEAIVCHTDMKLVGGFSCSYPLLNQLYQNVVWGMRGNFFSVPMDCPQRDERLGWSGDLALFAPTAVLIYDCFSFLKNWLIDVEYDQRVLGGVPAMVTPNATLPDPVWCRRVPCAIWHDVTILAPWALYEETGDESILAQQYNSMLTWMRKVPVNTTGAMHLWDTSVFNLGDWLDPAAPPNAPWKGVTDAKMVANAFLIHSLDLMCKVSQILGQDTDKSHFVSWSEAARKEFQDEYVTTNGRIVSDSQTAYALAICFDLLNPSQRKHAGGRLAYLVRKNEFKIGTGFAGTPYICEALALTGNIQVAYAMLLEEKCPSWLYPVTMGATTVWERWDSMLPDGSVNPGEMTSFNHYAFGAIAKFMYERVAGLRRVEPGWKRFCVAPEIGAEISNAAAKHVTPFGLLSCSWKSYKNGNGPERLRLEVSVPYSTICDVILPDGDGKKRETIGQGDWVFEMNFTRDYEWPVEPLPPKS
ncbi:probable beta-glucosidase O [Aspergillus udagawae]|uniref:alpha-L-rhamnosidase n=1 Tax=Aspergillus udagawae TaxID=91492 RepID=A0ABQ1AAL6_9EURO|nr:probable beta-glucosidase O [Aspergillus udagawae]GFF77469.1 probable beta-glucosidase O [Aspergillus udagawae]GFG18904.1 probable beta-glucosidase O [Aspergillus udagawae]